MRKPRFGAPVSGEVNEAAAARTPGADCNCSSDSSNEADLQARIDRERPRRDGTKILVRCEIEVRRHASSRLESKGNLLTGDKAGQEQARADEQNLSHRQFGDHDGVMPTPDTLASGQTRGRVWCQRAVTCQLERWTKAKQRCGQERCPDGEGQHDRLNADLLQARQATWCDRDQRLESPGSQQQP